MGVRAQTLVAGLAVGIFLAAVSAASASPVTVTLVARGDPEEPNGHVFSGPNCETTDLYAFRFPPRALRPRLDTGFRKGTPLLGPEGAGGEGSEGVPDYARIVSITRREQAGVAVFDLTVAPRPDVCASFPPAGAPAGSWRTAPVQVFGYYRLRVAALYTVDLAGTRRSSPPRAFAIGSSPRRTVTGIRWRNWGRQVTVGHGVLRTRGRKLRYRLEAYNPEYCGPGRRVFYSDYLIRREDGRDRRLFDLTASCRRLIQGGVS